MLITEYDEERTKRLFIKEGERKGIEKGIEKGRSRHSLVSNILFR